jgi:type II secretory pathway pseudopilin PulG
VQVLHQHDLRRELTPKMTNHSSGADHNISGYCFLSDGNDSSATRVTPHRSEAGYTLVALLALMTVVALLAMAVAPSIEQQSQREREKEAIFRGEQVADAIREYYRYRFTTNRVTGDQALPTSMDQLLQGVPIPGGSKTRQILRASAARDPLTIEGEWRFIHPRSQPLVDFQEAVMSYAGNIPPTPRDPQMAQLQLFAVPQITSVLNTGTTSKSDSSSSTDDDSTGPFVGVASRSRRASVLTYYGIETHDGWIFTPLFRN